MLYYCSGVYTDSESCKTRKLQVIYSSDKVIYAHRLLLYTHNSI